MAADTLRAKALRVILTFALVFWCSFQVEAFAWAALIADNGSAHETETLNDLAIYEVDNSDPTRLAGIVRTVRDTATGKAQSYEPMISGNAGIMQFVAVPTWLDNVAVTDSPDDVVIADFVEWTVSDPSIATIEANGGVATLVGQGAGSVTVTCRLNAAAQSLVSASFASELAGMPFEASFTVRVVKPYIASIEIHKPDGSLCLDGEEITLTPEERTSYGLWAKVNVFDEITGQSIPYDITANQGLPEASGVANDIMWTSSDESIATVQGGVVTFAKAGSVAVHCSTQQGQNGALSSHVTLTSQDEQKDEPEPQPVEPVDPQGEDHHQDTLTVTIDVPKSALGDDQQPESEDETQTSVEEGSSSSSEPAATTDNSASSAASGSAASSSATEKQSGESSAPSEDEESGQPTIQPGSKTYTLADLEALELGTEQYTMTSPSGTLVVTGRGPTLAQLLDTAGVPVDLQGQIESIEFVNYLGEPMLVNWSDLVAVSKSSDVDAQGLHRLSVMVAAYSRVMTPESDTSGGLKATADNEPSDSQDAKSSEPAASTDADSASAEASASSAAAVDTEGSSGSSSSASSGSAATDETQLLDNTRFRLLYHGSGNGALSDPDSLRWINEIIVHVKAPEPVVPEKEENEFNAYIEYNPVPKGKIAKLSPHFELPVGNTFGFKWQVSKNGKDWEDYSTDTETNTSRQTLEIMTDDEHIGLYYRFILNTDITDEETGEYKQAASDPVQITEGSGFVVTLSYVPPIAGDVANFTSSVFLTEEVGGQFVESELDPSKVRYVWEASEDGGRTWSGDAKVLARQSGFECSTLRVQTSPVTSSASNSTNDSEETKDGTPQSMVYIHVVAYYNGMMSVSNAQPLTVRVGETGGDKSDEVETLVNEETNQQPEQQEQEQVETPDETPVQPTTPPVQVTQVQNMVHETTPATSTVAPTNTTPEPVQQSQQIDPSQIYVNDAITEAIVEQRETAQEYMNSTTPGARWTQLSSVNPTAEDVNAIMAVNPFAPFAIPLGLGITAAGAVEKVVGFRRQTR